jgi:hypothetical protein
MCGACGSGLIRPPWEAILAGDRPADRRRRAMAAGQATGGRVKVSAWGAAGYVATPRTGPPRAFPDLEHLAVGLLPHLHLAMPDCRSCRHSEERRLVSLPADTDRQRLAVWAALATAHRGAGRLTIEIHAPRPAPFHAGSEPPDPSERPPVCVCAGSTAQPSMLLYGPHAEEYAANLEDHLGTDSRRAVPGP